MSYNAACARARLKREKIKAGERREYTRARQRRKRDGGMVYIQGKEKKRSEAKRERDAGEEERGREDCLFAAGTRTWERARRVSCTMGVAREPA